MISIFTDVWGHIRSLKPAFLSRHPHFNFITVHYWYILGMIILCSLCLYIRGGIAYIDALFLSSGAATQSGLNTVNLNALNTWQQAAIMTVALITNPISINTYVVFLRLYWFERRFQEVVKLAKKGRRTIAKSFSKSKEEPVPPGHMEKGVHGRNIVVMHETTGHAPKEISKSDSLLEDQQANDAADTTTGIPCLPIDSLEAAKGDSSDSSEVRLKPTETATHTPQIKFADQVTRSNGMPDEDLRLPGQRSEEEHIAVLQRQRNPESSAILRIPGPRDADAGIAPHYVDETDADLSRMLSGRTSVGHSRRGSVASHIDDNVDQGPVRRNITIQDPETQQSPRNLASDASAARDAVKSPFLNHRTCGTSRSVGGRTPDLNKDGLRSRKRAGTFNSIKHALTTSKSDYGTPYLNWEPTIGRNSEFMDLTEEQREDLGGIEYRSLKTLALILVAYTLGFLALGIIGLTPWIIHSKTYGPIVTQDGQGRPWWAIFTATSGFTDLGFTLTPDSMASFQTAVWPLLLMSFLIVIGNTGFPIMLRFIIWVTSKYVPVLSGIYEELRFLLDHPRRCFTLLFPSSATWWLFGILIGLNGVDILFFILLDLKNTVVTELPVHVRVLDGWFQAVSTRTAGFSVVSLAELHPGIQVSYMVMMYISILPIAISVRRTNVYEEKSLGIYGSASAEHDDEQEPSYVGAHVRRQLSFDLWYIFLGFFIIAIAEGHKLQTGDPSFTMFAVLFEVVSAYGTVGLSLGYTGFDTSLSGQFSTISKLVIIAMQIRGRHRGLPFELDRAILLPSEHLQQQEIDEARNLALRRSNTMLGMSGIVSSGAIKTAPARGRSRDQKASNVLGNLFHAGPAIPDHFRIDPSVTRRRHSIAIAEGRKRSDSESSAGNMGLSIGDSTNLERPRRSGSRFSGRRMFHQEASVPEAANET
ncbi:cation transport protein-domain-containing protein [Calycina marina]|uniref:Potassium transport protein n=1 Tax=Calycina marina TaxID=1763456 RepID=A0A9P7Z330_9HELO|nr:cation transport protein-domain-containing protein [Calycina marina]